MVRLAPVARFNSWMADFYASGPQDQADGPGAVHRLRDLTRPVKSPLAVRTA